MLKNKGLRGKKDGGPEEDRTLFIFRNLSEGFEQNLQKQGFFQRLQPLQCFFSQF
jgi:hypothetical protein